MKKGVTLIEVLVTSLILTIVITGMLMTFVYCQRMAIETTNVQNASMIINEKFEQIQRLNSENAMINIIRPLSQKYETVVRYTSKDHPVNYYVSFSIVDSTLNPLPGVNTTLVEAKVEWDSPKGKKDLTMQMFTNDEERF